MNLAPSTFYYRPKIDPKEREKKDADLRDLIESIQLELPGYGHRRLYQELLRRHIRVNKKRIRRIQEKYGLFPIVWKKFVTRTTDSNHHYRIYPNLTKDLAVTAVNQVWVADITYIRILTCFVYLAVILDRFSRKVIGWAIAKSLHRSLAIDALRMAIDDRDPSEGCIHHSDQGVQYASEEYVKIVEDKKMKVSMSRKGNCYDNAFAETFFKTLKYEEVHLSNYETYDDVLKRVPFFIEEVYNKKRLHSSLGYLTPQEFESKKPSQIKTEPVTLA
jgi:transposase InsO family protein